MIISSRVFELLYIYGVFKVHFSGVLLNILCHNIGVARYRIFWFEFPSPQVCAG
jgi:hypothetical protein